MTTEMHGHYRAVLDDLGAKKAKVLQELNQLDAAIAAIKSLAGDPVQVQPQRPTAQHATVPNAPVEHGINYAAISVRWAVLSLLADVATGPMSTGQIAEALQQRGVKKETKSPFGNIVSAVLSNLRVKGEVEPVGDGLYQLSDAGRSMWKHIKSGPKFQAASTSPTLLDAQ